MQVSGKTAVITGGASGLGEAAARHLYSLGANIVIADLNDERGQQLKSELGQGKFKSCSYTGPIDSSNDGLAQVGPTEQVMLNIRYIA
jgi:NAD(P)-dependent dehydrogenase (short-subunit alcohol dehydrogenase family)